MRARILKGHFHHFHHVVSRCFSVNVYLLFCCCLPPFKLQSCLPMRAICDQSIQLFAKFCHINNYEREKIDQSAMEKNKQTKKRNACEMFCCTEQTKSKIKHPTNSLSFGLFFLVLFYFIHSYVRTHFMFHLSTPMMNTANSPKTKEMNKKN